MANAQFPEPKDLDVPIADRIGDGKTLSFQQYTVSNPHPGYGKDPNILNEYGHSVYPKMIYPNGIGQAGVTVNSEAEEVAHYKPAEEIKPELKTDGPTVEDYVKAGYKASNYPPEGYASKSTDDEIKAAIAAEAPAPNPWPTSK